ncbi:hypothetical protein [Halalkalicoccus tibetensis]|uniref:Small CPxCG-related zinc finger protein n=1 Tax=Halalkalicoccus tibetensis TaxID=175632 RepID=A0ABD5UXT0_9EURY
MTATHEPSAAIEGTATERGICSACGGVAINVQGLLDCPDCGV